MNGGNEMDMQFPECGMCKERVIERIEKYMDDNHDYGKSHVLNSICSEPLEIGKEAYMMALNTNLGDMRLFAGSKKMEEAVASKLCDLLSLSSGVGNVVCGGTEANLLAMFVAKKISESKNITAPEIVAPESIHFSVIKAATIMGIQLKLSKLDGNHRAIPKEMEEKITPNTIAFFATAGTSETGAVDPINKIADISKKYGLYFHVDAASGGFLIPFAKELGYYLPEFDFSIEAVQSITVDPHKYGFSVIPSGFILFRNKVIRDYIDFESFFVGTKTHRTFSGTRTGAGLASIYAIIQHLGKSGFKNYVLKIFTCRDILIRELQKKNMMLFGEPDLNIVLVKSKHPEETMQRLEKKGYYVSVSKRYHAIRIVVNRQNNEEELKELAELLYQTEH